MKRVAVVGSRWAPEEYLVLTEIIVENLPKDVVVVSGYGSEIDITAIHAAIERGLKTLAILPCPNWRPWPPEEIDVVVTGIKCDRRTIAIRSKMLAKFADEVHVVYVRGSRCGTMYTIEEARKLGVPIKVYRL